MKNVNVLLAASDRDLSDALATYLKGQGNGVEVAFDGVQALNCFGEGAFDVVVLDEKLSRIVAADVVQRIRQKSDVAIAMIFDGGKRLSQYSDNYGYDEVLNKPFTQRQFAEALERLAAKRQFVARQVRDVCVDAPSGKLIGKANSAQISLSEAELLVSAFENASRFCAEWQLAADLNEKLRAVGSDYALSENCAKGYVLERI